MKNWYKFWSVLLIALFIAVQAGSMPAMAQQSQSPSGKTDQDSTVVTQDDKRSMTVMTKGNEDVEITKKDFLNDAFTPVGDVSFGIIKTSSDIIGGACQGFVDGVEGIFKFILKPFGFKNEPSEKRAYFS